MEFTGNDRTRDRVLRRQMLLKEGRRLQLRQAAHQPAAAEPARVTTSSTRTIRSRSTTTRTTSRSTIVVKGTETGQTEVQFGGGYSELDGFFVQSALRTRNFLGRGETVGVSIQTGRYRDIFDVSYYMPWVKDRPQNFGVQLFNRDTDFDLLIRPALSEQGGRRPSSRSAGTSAPSRWSSCPTANMDIESYQSQTFYFFDNPQEQEGDPNERHVRAGVRVQTARSVTATYQFDSHNSRLEPTQGKRLVASLEYAGGPLGGESYFIRPSLTAAITVPLTSRGLRTVGRANLQLGYIEPFGEDDAGGVRQLFFLDRYLLGGENSLRGFAFRSIWVRDPETGPHPARPERLPPGRQQERRLQPGAPHPRQRSLPRRRVLRRRQRLRATTRTSTSTTCGCPPGSSCGVNVPILGAPLRFIYATNLNPLDDLGGYDRERFDSFDFSIGTSF